MPKYLPPLTPPPPTFKTILREYLEGVIENINENPPDPHEVLYFLAHTLNRYLKPEGKVCALYKPPTIRIGTGVFTGDTWASPSRVILLPTLVSPVGGGMSGRGVALRNGEVVFHTELDECLVIPNPNGEGYVVPSKDIDFITDKLNEWYEQICKRAP